MRPTYETQGDVDNEREVMRLLCAKWQCQFAKLPKKYALDYVLIRHDEVKAFAEVKCRTNPVGAYPTYMLALQKVIAAKELTRSTGKPSMLIVRWSDAIGYTHLAGDYKVRVGGRVDRGDWQDVEPVVDISLDDFVMWATDAP